MEGSTHVFVLWACKFCKESWNPQADTTSNYHMDNMYLSINVVCKDSDTVSLNHNLRSAQGFTVASIHFN